MSNPKHRFKQQELVAQPLQAKCNNAYVHQQFEMLHFKISFLYLATFNSINVHYVKTKRTDYPRIKNLNGSEQLVIWYPFPSSISDKTNSYTQMQSTLI